MKSGGLHCNAQLWPSRKRKDTTPSETPSSLLPSPGSGLEPLLPRKLDVAYLFRAPDKHVSVHYRYPEAPLKWVEKKDCSEMIDAFSAMQREDLVKLHGKDRYKKGEYGAKEPKEGSFWAAMRVAAATLPRVGFVTTTGTVL